MSLPTTLFGSVPVAERTQVIELKSVYGLSDLRNITTTEGSATVTHAGAGAASEYVLTTTASGTDRAVLDSAERGRYVPGTEGETGIGVRLGSDSLTDSQVARWGYFDDDDGYGFGYDADGLFVFVRRSGSDRIIRRAQWNGEGTGGGMVGREIDVTDGGIWQVNYSWYGYGAVYWSLVQGDDDGVQRVHVLHRFEPERQTSVAEPNLPIRAEIDNDGTATAQTMNVAGRQYSVVGRFRPNRRVNGHYRLAHGSIGTTFVPVISFRRKSAYRGVSVKLEGVDLVADANLLWQVRLDGALTGASYETPADTTATETACEVDTSATAISGGHPIFSGVAVASTNQAKTLSGQSGLGFDLPAMQPITLCARLLTGTGGTINAAALRWREEW